MIKTLRKVKIKWSFLNLSKRYLQKVITNIILHNEILKALNEGQDKNSGQSNQGRKRNGRKTRREENKTLFSDNMDVISKVNMLIILHPHISLLGNNYSLFTKEGKA